MDWLPYAGPVVDLDKAHYHAWIRIEHSYTGMDGKPSKIPAYFATLRSYHNPMTARNQAKYFMNPAYGRAGVMVLKCDGSKTSCPTWVAALVGDENCDQETE